MVYGCLLATPDTPGTAKGCCMGKDLNGSFYVILCIYIQKLWKVNRVQFGMWQVICFFMSKLNWWHFHSNPSAPIARTVTLTFSSAQLLNRSISEKAQAPQRIVAAGMVARTRNSGNGSSSSGSSPNHANGDGDEGCKDRIGNWPMDELAVAWDNCPLVRERLRGGHNLNMNYDQEKHVATDSYVEKTIPSLKLNHFVVSPLLKMMAANDRTLPNLDRLLQQVTAIRRLCGVAKKLLYRPSLPKDQGGAYHEKCHLNGEILDTV